uniref:Uncharacterized protein n=1 Tax=Anguilla anguilla TaxID=7936 RepID=A0A0E9XKY3_ANGAN
MPQASAHSRVLHIYLSLSESLIRENGFTVPPKTDCQSVQYQEYAHN